MRSSLVLASLAVLAACHGNIGRDSTTDRAPDDRPVMPGPEGPLPPVGGAGGPLAPPVTMPGPGPVDPPAGMPGAGHGSASGGLRRLTRNEFRNTIRDLLGYGAEFDAAAGFLPDARVGAFENNLDFPATGTIPADYLDAAERVAADRVASKPDAIIRCDFAARGEACARELVTGFGKRALRRPLPADEVDAYLALYGKALAEPGATYKDGMRLVVTALLQAPEMIYHLEVGDPTQKAGARVPLTNHEIASRLSYMFLSSMPDAELFAAADAGKLQTLAGIREQADRLLKLPRTQGALMRFFRQWLNFETSLEVYNNPIYGAARPYIATEVEMLIQSVIFAGDGKWSSLLTARHSHVNGPLAAVYGIPGVTGTTMVRTELDPAQRAGFLTMPIILANTSHADGTTRPTIRGQLIRQRLLCQEMPPPPPDLVSPKLPGNLTSRQKALMHQKDPFCASCHRLMDPIGVAFDRHRADGVYRTPDPAKPDGYDDAGELLGTDVDGKFNGVPALAERLSRSAVAAACVPRQWFRWAIGRDPEEDTDGPSLGAAVQRFTATGGDIRDLFVSLTQVDAFRFLDIPAEEACR